MPATTHRRPPTTATITERLHEAPAGGADRVAPRAGQVWRWGRTVLTAEVLEADADQVRIRAAGRAGAPDNVWTLAQFLAEWDLADAERRERVPAAVPVLLPGVGEPLTDEGLAALADEAHDAHLCGNPLAAGTAGDVLRLLAEVAAWREHGRAVEAI